MTERQFLPHDLGTRNDPKIVALEEDNPLLKAIWWDVLEMLYEQGGSLPTNYKRLAYMLRYPTAEQVRHLVEDFDLFTVEGDIFYNASAIARIERKEDAKAQKREAGRMGGRPRKQTENQPESTEKAEVFEEKSGGFPKLNQIKENQRKIISQSAGAGAPTREEEEDFLLGKFFFRNFTEPEKETARCLDHYKDTGIKDREAVAKKWTPEKAQPRFDDARILPWVKKLWAIVSTSANPHEGAELLRHIDAAAIDRSANELRVRMRGNSWGEAVAATVEINPPLKEGFDKVSVTKVRGS